MENRATRWLLTLAACKAVLALCAFVFVTTAGRTEIPLSLRPGVPPGDPTYPYFFYLVYLLSFGLTAGFLLLGGRHDSRAAALGGFYLVSTSAFARPLYDFVPLAESPFALVAQGLAALPVQAFMPYFFWHFVVDFPALPLRGRLRPLVRNLIRLSGALGAGLLLANLLRFALASPSRLLAAFTPSSPLFYGLVLSLTAAALALLLWKATQAQGPEHRRARLFVYVLGLGLGPIFLLSLIEIAVPPYARYVQDSPRLLLGLRWGFSALAWLLPPATAWAVLVHQMLDVRRIAGKALQYALARYTTLAFAALPFASLLVSLYRRREQTVADVLSGGSLVWLVAGTILGLAALRYRTSLLESIDRRFFREQFDARQILGLVLQRIRGTRDVRELTGLICRGVDRALHVDRVAVLVEERQAGLLIDPTLRARRLDSSSPLAQLLASGDALAIELENPRSPVARLPEADRHWLLDSGFHLLTPILARDGSLLGVIGLGAKRSGLPFLREDRKLLYDLAGSAGLGLEIEMHMSRSSHPGGGGPARREEGFLPGGLSLAEASQAAAETAKECATCGTLFPRFTVLCTQCSRRLDGAMVPYVLPGKFRFERRVGVGGMGVVYRASDLTLGRVVAVKTLRHLSPEDAMLLRREARTAAAVTHPHLASVYGVETWQGTPMVVLEFMESGTLAEKLRQGALAAPATLELGIAIASALEHLHQEEILHRDVKPSNIGFSKEGVAKLMDFGIARLMFEAQSESGISWEELEELDEPVDTLSSTATWDSPTSATRFQNMAGTLSYLSPEALNGEPPHPSFDLWSLSLVLYECLLGRKIFAGATLKQAAARIRTGRIPDFEQTLPSAPALLAELFRSLLHRNPARRPASARELRERLIQAREALA